MTSCNSPTGPTMPGSLCGSLGPGSMQSSLLMRARKCVLQAHMSLEMTDTSTLNSSCTCLNPLKRL